MAARPQHFLITNAPGTLRPTEGLFLVLGCNEWVINMAWSYYREKAAQYHHLAETAPEPDIRKSYEILEWQWIEIANREDRVINSAKDWNKVPGS